MQKGSKTETVLYSFAKGELCTLQVPSLRMTVHSQRFPGHRCGFCNGKLYFLEEAYADIARPNNSLGFTGTLKIYDPFRMTVERTVSTCACNYHAGPLLIRGSEILDLGTVTKVINCATGARKIPIDSGGSDCVYDFGAVLMHNKTIYMAGGWNDFLGLESDDEETKESLSLGGLHAISCSNFSANTFLNRFSPVIRNVSVLPMHENEFLILGEEKRTAGTVVYRFSASTQTVTKEGVLSRKLGQSVSSCLLQHLFYMFFPKGLVAICDLRTGMMRLVDLTSYEKVKAVLWTMGKRQTKRLPEVLVRHIIGYIRD